MTERIPKVIIIRGAPGVGKSETAKYLSNRFPDGVRLEVDRLREMVISVDWTNQSEHIKILRLAVNLVAGFCESGYRPVIVIDTFSGDKIAQFLIELKQQVATSDIRVFAIVASPEALNIRILNRPPNKFRDNNVCQMINSDVLKYLQEVEELIDNTNLSVSQTADTIWQSIISDTCVS